MNEYSWDRTGVSGGSARQGRGHQNFDRDEQWESDRRTHSYGRGWRDEGERSSGSSLRDTGYEHMSPGSSAGLRHSWDDGRYQSAPSREGNRSWRGEYGDGEEFGGERYGASQSRQGRGGFSRYDSRGEAWSAGPYADSGRFDERLREPSGRGYGRGRPDMGTYGWSRPEQGSYGGSSMGAGYGGSSYGGSSYGGSSYGNRSDDSRPASIWSSVGSRMDYSGRGPKGYRRNDERIEEEVNERLKADRDIDASDIEVSVSSGVVTLSGTVGDRRSKRMAEECCDDISGVDDVTNQIRVKAHDDELTSQKSSSTSASSKSGTQQSSSRNTSASGQTVSPSRS